MDISKLTIDEAEDILISRLTKAEKEQVFDIYKDIGAEIRWGRVLDKLWPDFLNIIQDVIFGLNEFRGPRFTKRDPWQAVKDQELFEDGDERAMHRRHLLLLLILKKLLGGAKTRVNQDLAAIPTLDPDEESELIDMVQLAREQEEEEEMLREREVRASLERRKQASLLPEGDCRQNGRHVRTVIRIRKRGDDIETEQYCRDCRQVVKRKVERSGRRADPDRCEHPSAEWVPGKEGQEAFCTKCKGTIPNPETFTWVKAGLEPYGDDPSQDEAITLCSDY